MKQRIIGGAVLAMAVLAGNAIAAGTLQSGPQPGDKVSAFEPLHINGQYSGKHVCLV